MNNTSYETNLKHLKHFTCLPVEAQNRIAKSVIQHLLDNGISSNDVNMPPNAAFVGHAVVKIPLYTDVVEIVLTASIFDCMLLNSSMPKSHAICEDVITHLSAGDFEHVGVYVNDDNTYPAFLFLKTSSKHAMYSCKRHAA